LQRFFQVDKLKPVNDRLAKRGTLSVVFDDIGHDAVLSQRAQEGPVLPAHIQEPGQSRTAADITASPASPAT